VVDASRWARLALLSVLITGGCGEKVAQTPASVAGRVTFQGQPLIGGVIVFVPDSERGKAGPSFTASLNDRGEYRLINDGSPRVPPGWYRVAIADPPSPGRNSPEYARFPPSLRRPDQAGLRREIRPGEENWLEFHIEVSE